MSIGDTSGTRAVHDDAPADLRAAASTGDLSGTRAIQDTPPFEGNVNAVASTGDPYSGQYIGTSPDFQASVADRMADSAADATRAVNDVAPFDSGTNTVASGNEFIGGDITQDPGTQATHGFVPSDSADVQREMLDGTTDGGALGNTGSGHPS